MDKEMDEKIKVGQLKMEDALAKHATIMIEPKGIYYYFLAYIKYDHHHRKFYKTTPNYEELLMKATASGYSDTDVENLYNLLGVSRPEVL